MTMKTGRQKSKRYKAGQRNLLRTFLAQIVPLVMMLFIGSWLTLSAGKVIDQTRGEALSLPALEQSLPRF